MLPTAPESPTPKPPLDRESLRDVIDLSLWAGQMLLRSGAQASRIERTVHTLGTALGANWLDVLVLPEGLIVTTSSGEEFRTRVRRVTGLGVNMTQLEGIQHLTARAIAGELDRFAFREALEKLNVAKPNYSRATVVFLVGLACAAFSQLFGGDLKTLVVTLVASSLAMFVRQELHHRLWNPLLITIATAFVAGIVPGLAWRFGVLPEPECALAASVLLLVPGVPLINAARDILRGYLVTGTARGMSGLVSTLSIALGLLTALEVSGLRVLPLFTSPSRSLWLLLALDLVWSGFAALGFAILFNAPRKALAPAFVGGAIGHALRALLTVVHVPLVLGTLAGAILVGFFAEFCAKKLDLPGGVISVPSAIPMVPGVFAFRAMISLIGLAATTKTDAALELTNGIRNFTSTGLILAGLAMGIALPSLILRREKPVV